MKVRIIVFLACAAVLAADTNQPSRAPLKINAEFGRFDLKSHIAYYSNNVVVTDPPAKPGDAPTMLRCQELTATAGTNGRIEMIVAHGQVQIDHSNKLARAERAVYYATNETMVLTGAFDSAHPLPYLVASGVTNVGTRIVYRRLEDSLGIDEIQTYVPGAALQNSGSDSLLKPKAPKVTPAAPE